MMAFFFNAWEQRKLGEIGVVIDPHPSHRAPKEVEGGIPFIGIGDVDEMGNINKATARLVDPIVYEEHHQRYDLAVPSLGLGRVASLGKVIKLRNNVGKYAISPTMSVLQFGDGFDVDYLYAFMNSDTFQKQFEARSSGSTRQSVGTESVRIMEISLPNNLKEQKTLGAFFRCIDSSIVLHQRE
jgi:type I restriction enzyme S subunit